MNNPQQLKERIYALNPELKALTMGCEVMTNSGIRKLISDGCLGSGFSGYQYTIGHPIHLEHILRAIFESLKFNSHWKGHGDVMNKLFIPTYNQGTYKNKEMYDLTKTFDQNIAENEELVDFLLSVIKE